MAYPRNPTQTFKPERGIVRTHQQAKNTLLSFITLSLIFAALLFAGNAKASAVDDLSKRGQGEMSYLFWTLYSAEFYTAPSSSERALKIEYYRAIDSKDLVEATEDQWNKLGYPNSNIERWLKPLYSMWPNVEAGSTLTIRVAEDNVSRFYFDEQPIGVIQDKQFGDAFLAIWLSENTSEPGLRKQLLGLNK
ncbi:Chalcone_isomerase domain-containing protein [Vibrio chagasii]|nr:Chalcone_isomerase domain-containing protein [Vibrio chagasii]CAH6888332.1 Chalcone_isomerase domain-containing protein [Vibrio chagasii]CAH7078161.1 Chalcone_isomerase domain-containing protein [Vibrio chagasii]CAH7101606.1 Chalcone_isomerase domain-containing protein [Vibrio chagasii]CAH7123451.1 Chalcone_isomerase domain-containing protein [Vibrio chagasii]